MHVCTCLCTHVEARRQLAGVHFFLLPYGHQGLNSGCQAWKQGPVPVELPHQPSSFKVLKNYICDSLQSLHPIPTPKKRTIPQNYFYP